MTERHRLHGELWRRALMWGSVTLPQPAKVATMPLWAAIPFVLVPRARRQIACNLARVVGPASGPVGAARAYRVLLSFAQSLANSYAAHGGRGVAVATDILGEEGLRQAGTGGRGVIVATGHIGPWQLGPYLLERAGYGPVVIAMAREPDAAAQRYEEAAALRGRFRVVHTDGPFASLELLRVLRRGGIVAVQMDRAPASRNGVGGANAGCLLAPFLGGAAPFPVGPAALARAAGAPLVPVFLLAQGPSRVRVEIGEPIVVARTGDRASDVAEATRRLAGSYEACVRAHPYQWYSFHDFWAAA
ncbi:MAG TPA: lysophospholipid acyltransferase family protein [Polyangia bacterium]|nr:lysophospholipid acyltransferase family protein [Polyangia bacterium]